jgi:hypothetical protein
MVPSAPHLARSSCCVSCWHIEPRVGLKLDSGRLYPVLLSNLFVRDILVDSELRKTSVSNIRLKVEIQPLIRDFADSLAKGHCSVVMLGSSALSYGPTGGLLNGFLPLWR